MPSALSTEASPRRHDDLDNYNVEDLSDDPFASPSPSSASKKRKQPQSGLGIDEEVSVQKRARVPNVKLDEERLLGPAGIPKLRARARELRLKGKGHEFSDASRLLSFYQLWLDDLFPKAKFLDALAMIEKAGHKKKVVTARNDWISEGKQKDKAEEDEAELGSEGRSGDENMATQYPGDRSPPSQRFGEMLAGQDPKTPPTEQDVPDDDDIYDTTPRPSNPSSRRIVDDPEEDDLDALIAEAEGTHDRREPRPSNQELGGNELDALIADAEDHDNHQPYQQPQLPIKTPGAHGVDDFDDDEAAILEMQDSW